MDLRTAAEDLELFCLNLDFCFGQNLGFHNIPEVLRFMMYNMVTLEAEMEIEA